MHRTTPRRIGIAVWTTGVYASSVGLCAAGAWSLQAKPALADERPFVWTYGAQPESAGERELEARVINTDATAGTFHEMLSLDYGITDRWTVEPYVVVAHTGLSDLHLDGLQLETRYAAVLETKVIPAVSGYLEYEQPIRNTDPDWPGDVEAKILVSKRIGGLDLGVNLIAHQDVVARPTDWGYDAGAVYSVLPGVGIGVEALGDQLFSATPPALNVGPTIMLTELGQRIGLNYAFGLNGAPAQAQLIGSVEF